MTIPRKIEITETFQIPEPIKNGACRQSCPFNVFDGCLKRWSRWDQNRGMMPGLECRWYDRTKKIYDGRVRKDFDYD